MKKYFLLGMGLMACMLVVAQVNPEKYAATITTATLKQQLSIIAGPEMEGRETGTPGQRKAAEYIESEFKKAGLLAPAILKGYQQSYLLSKDSVAKSRLKIGGKKLVFGVDYAASVQANSTQTIKTKHIVFVGYGINDPKYNDYAGKNLKDNIALMFVGEPKQDSINIISNSKKPSEWGGYAGLAKKLEAAKNNGARAVFLINAAMETVNANAANAGRKTSIYFVRDQTPPALNSITISHAVAGQLLGTDNFNRLLAKAKKALMLNEENLPATRSKTVFIHKEASEGIRPTNVIGYIEGTDKKDEYIMLTGHYDHLGMRNGAIYYGADDDGSGTCAVMQMAAAFAKAKAEGNGPRRTVVFMAVSGEEKGLWGSEYYSDHPIFPLDRTAVNLNTDMVGRIDPKRTYGDSMNYVYIIGDDKLSTDLKPISETVNNRYTRLELDYKYNDPKDKERIYYRSDHYNFARKGVPIIFYFNGTHADYHRPTDTVDKINWDLYQKRVHLIFHTAWEMANRDAMPKRDIPFQ